MLTKKQEIEAWNIFFPEWKSDWESKNPLEKYPNKSCWIMERYHNFNAAWYGFKEGYKKGLKK